MVKYQGNDAEQHIIDSQQYGESISGAGRLYVSVAHFCTYGEVLKPRQATEIKCYATEAKSGCYETGLIIAASASQLPLFAEGYKLYLDWLIGLVTKHIKETLTGRGGMEKLADIISERAKRDDKLNFILVNGILKSNDDMADISKALLERLPSLVDANRGNMKRLVTPIGRSCNEMQHFSGSENEFDILEADAAAIRSKNELEVDDMKDYECLLISELNTKTGHCHLHLKEQNRHVVGKISDPILQEPGNIYSKSLDAQTGFKFKAKDVTLLVVRWIFLLGFIFIALFSKCKSICSATFSTTLTGTLFPNCLYAWVLDTGILKFSGKP